MSAADPSTPSASPLRVDRVDGEGIHLRPDGDRVVDFTFDGHRVGSFWLIRDTVKAGRDRLYPWPDMLRRHLDGVTRLALVDHVAGRELFAAEVAFGSGRERIAVQDPQGNPLGLDKSGRLMRLFDTRSDRHLGPLLDAVDSVIEALESCGVEPFLAYGTLLGAVREGTLIGHDSDVDLAYVSRHEHPVDVVLESFRLQRRLVERGLRITRYSGLAFKIAVEEADGAHRGLDVFGGFQREGYLYLMGEVRAPFRDEWLHPRSEVSLDGRTFPSPAHPEHLLAAMYGPEWRVPDPAFKFETPLSTRRRLSGWFRGTRVYREANWDSWYHRGGAPLRQPVSGLARWVAEREPDLETVIDVGCGSGSDAVWLSRRARRAIGVDYVVRAFRRQERQAMQAGLPVEFRWANLSELRSTLVTGAELAREPGPRIMLARHVADSTNKVGREHLLLLARMVTRGSGRLYLQVLGRQDGDADEQPPHGVSPLDLDDLLELIEARGGDVVERVQLTPEEDQGDPEPPGPRQPTISRLVIQWNT